MSRKMRDLMSSAPVCMAPGEPVAAAARAMKRHGVGTVLVLSGGQFTGLLTERDIAVRVLAEHRDPAVTPVGDICSDGLAMLGPDDEVEDAARVIRQRPVRRIPILDRGMPVGVVSVGDLALGQPVPASGA